MRLELTVARTALVVGESPPAALTLENDGPAPAPAPNPSLNKELPLLRVRGPGPSDTAEHAPGPTLASRGVRLLPASEEDAPIVDLAPGARLRLEFDLLERAALPGPGRYEVEAVLRGPRRPDLPPPVEDVSAAVALEVAPVEPVRVSPAHGHGGLDDEAYVAWVQGGERPGVHVTSFELVRGRSAPRLSFRAAPSSAEVEPMISVTPAGEPPTAPRVVAWVEGDGVRFLPFGERAPAPDAEPGQVRVGVAPRLLGPPVQDARTGHTRAFVIDGAGRARALALGEGPEDVLTLELPAPAWSHVVVPARGGPRVLLATSGPEGVALHEVAWDAEARRPRRLGAWKGELAAAAAVVDDDGVVGALLTWFRRRPAEDPALLVVRWRLDPATGRFDAATPATCPWDRRLAPRPITLRLGAGGAAFALFQDDEGRWLYAPGLGPPSRVFADPADLPSDPSASPRPAPPLPVGPLDLMFFSGGAAPFLLLHEAEAGLRVLPLGAEGPPDPGSPEMAQPELD